MATSTTKKETTAESFDSSALNLYQKIAAITGEIGAIKKDGHNREQGYAFIEYAAVAGQLRELLAKYRVVIDPQMAKASEHVRETVTTSKGGTGYHVLIDFNMVMINADKPEEQISTPWTGEATDYGDKATTKAATSAVKYYLMRKLNISEKGDDPDKDSPEQAEVQPIDATKPTGGKHASEAQLNVLKGLAIQAGYDKEWRDATVAKVQSSSRAASEVITTLQEKVVERIGTTGKPAEETPNGA